MSMSVLQKRVHVAKDKINDFGKYNYRTAEGILAAAKAQLPDGATIMLTDTLQEVAGQIFVSSRALVTFSDGSQFEATGHAMHPLQKKGMDASQITGTASSYARKYALAGLFALDDGSADPDAIDNREETGQTPPPPVLASIPQIEAAATGKELLGAIEGRSTSHADVKSAVTEQLRTIVKGAQSEQVLGLLQKNFGPFWAGVADDAASRRDELQRSEAA